VYNIQCTYVLTSVFIFRFTFLQSFIGVIKETDDLAGQHELIAENLNGQVYKELKHMHGELKNERNKVGMLFYCIYTCSVV